MLTDSPFSRLRTIVPLLLAVLIGGSISACVKVQVKPKEIVSDTVSAGKSLYRTIKRKKDGTEERLYAHTLQIQPDQSDAQAGIDCLDYLREVAEAATDNKMEILNESTEVGENDDTRTMTCKINAVV